MSNRTDRTLILESCAKSIACMVVLLLTGCGPGPGVYEGPLRSKTSTELKEGNEYLVFFEDHESKAWNWPGGGSEVFTSARGYPTLEAIVALYDQMGNSIPNLISSGKLQAYQYSSAILGFSTSGITVARFSLEGKATRHVEIYANLDAYGKFANLYNKRHAGGTVGPPFSPQVRPWAPLQPNKIAVRDASEVGMVFGVLVIFGIIAVICYVIYKKSQSSTA